MSLTAPSRLLAAIALLSAAFPPDALASGRDPTATEPTRTTAEENLHSLARMGQNDAMRSSLEAQLFGEHIGRDSRPASERAPHQPRLQDPRATDYSHSHAKSQFLQRPSDADATSVAKAVCDANQFASLSGSALVSAVTAASVSCINETFALSGSPANGAFRESQMVTIANAFRSLAASYNGTNSSGILQLILYLRAGYYVQFYDPAVGPYGASLRSAIQSALDTFASSPSFGLVNNTHGEVLAEFVTLIDSSEQNARYLDNVIKRLLDSYNSSYDAHYWMLVAVNNTFTVMFRAHQVAEFRTLVQNNTSIVDTLYGFANRNFSRLGTQQDYLVANAARETARFLQYSGNLKSVASSRSKALGDRSSITGVTAKVWIGIGEMVDYYDRANCAVYNMCDFANRVSASVLPINHSCSSSLRIRAQQISSAELEWTCQQAAGIDTYFHNQLQTGRVPVADDFNTALEMVVFNSSTDYQTYAGAIYGIDTNNGGMYLEGNPAAQGNQARFIAYEAEWRLPTFEIWNLHHEYVHYLDGRYTLYGDFSRSISQRTVWWIEGLAEYIAYGFRNLTYTAAVNEAARGTFPISTIYQNDYNSGQTRVYNWGYLAVRFMFEQRRSQVSDIVSRLRANDYTGYASLMNPLGSQNNSAFAAWLPCVGNPSGSGCGGGGNDTTPPTTPSNLSTTVRSSSQIDLVWSASTDTGGSSLAGYRIERCQGASCTNFAEVGTSTSPQFASTGLIAAISYRYRVRAFDGAGNTSGYSSIATAATSSNDGGGGGTALQNGVARTGLAAATGSVLRFTLDVPAGASDLRFEMSGGSGDADMHVRFGQEPTTTTYDCRPYASGNTETCPIGSPQAGRYHVMLSAYSAFSGVNLVGRFTATTADTVPPTTPGSLTATAASSSQINLSWTASTDTGGSGLAGYRIERCQGASCTGFAQISTATATQFADTGLTAATTYRYRVRAFDGAGNNSPYSTVVTIATGSGGGTGLPICTASDSREMGRNCRRTGLSAGSGGISYHFLNVPAGISQVRVRSSGGSGNADLYVSLSSWATPNTHHWRSTNSANTETLTISNPPAGYLFISLYGQSAFSGVELSTEY